MAGWAKKGVAGAVITIAVCVFVWSACRDSPERLPARHSGGLTVATLNLAMQKDARTILQDLAAAPEVRDADIFLFQEAVHSAAVKDGVAGEVARVLKFRSVFAPAGPGVYDRGLAVLSRYPMRDVHVRSLPHFDLRFHSRDRFVLAATVDTPAGPVRVWNVHLDTRVNAESRVEQLKPVVAEAAALSGPKIIAGDFNTNDFYWVWNVFPLPLPGVQGAMVRRFMSQHRFVAPYQDNKVTFNVPRMQLDWIYEQGLTARGMAVHKMAFSDHRALLARFQ